MTNTKMIKITGIMITLVMLVTTLGAFVLMANAADGTPVAKVGEVEYTDFATAVANWTDNTTLTLLADVTDLAEQIELSGNGLVLDLNGKKLEATVDHAIKISAGELTIRDSVGTGSFTTTQSGGLWVFGGNVNFESGTLESVTISKGTFNMTGGTIQTEAFTGIYVNGDEGTANISGGEINVTDDNLMGVYNGFGTLNLSGNVVITSTYGYAFQNSDASVLTTISGDVALNGSTGEFYLAKAIVMNTQPTGDTTWRVSINTGNNSGIENGIFAIPGDGVTLDPAKFTSPMDGYEVKLNNKNELVLCNHSAATVAVSNGNGTHNTTCDCNGIIFESNIACSGGVATANHLAVCAYCGGTYGELDANVNYDIIATAMTAAELKDAVAAWLADGNTDISILLVAYADEEMFTAVKTALAESSVANGSINLTLAGVKTIPDEALSDYPISIGGNKLKTLTLTDAETTGENEPFARCTYLESVSLPNATTIGAWAFNECSNLTSVYCPKVTVIGGYAFRKCAKLTTFDFTNITTIGNGAFSGCDFNTIVLPEATSIGGSAFVDNPNLISFSAPKATSFGWYPWGAETIETSKLESLELTAAGEFTIENNFSAYTPFEQINLVLNIDKKDQVTQKDDGTATWTYPYTNSSTGTETKIFKSITLTCVDGTTNHTYQYTDMSNGTHKAECAVEGCGFYKYEAHTPDEDTYTNNGDGTHSFTCTVCQTAATEGHTGGTATCKIKAKCERCGESYGEVDTTNHDSSVAFDAKGFCPNGCYQPATLNAAGYYEIDNAGKLFWFAAEVNGGNTEINGKLMTDIDLENRPWTPIGTAANKYKGIFDGNGKTISGLYFNDSAVNNVGLFGYIYDNGQVKAVTLTNSSITGRDSVGGIAGKNYGIITGCVNNAVVSGDYSSVGGIAGTNHGTVELCGNTGKITTATSEAGGIVGRNGGTIRNCYNTGDVYAERIDAGGIAGLSFGTVEYCWSTGNATAGSDYEGGIAGKNDGALLYCYSAEEPIGSYGSGGTYSYVGTRTAAQFASGEVAYLLGPAWGQTIGTNETPVFATDANKVYQSFECDGTTPRYTNDASLEGKAAPHTFGANSNGFCTECDAFQPAVYNEERGYYEISNAGQLFWFAGLVNGTLDGVAQNASANATLTDPIDLNIGATIKKDGTYESLDGLREWTPIGSSTTPYAGAFRGGQQSISHVYINGTDDYQGLFGYVTGTVNGCTVRDSYVKGKDYVGGVIGYLESSGDLLFCKNESPVTGEKHVGGVVGYADSVNLVNECANEGKVVGTEYVGGLIGYASYGVETIVKCENSGFISGEECVGGLLGWGDGTIENCTNDGDVSGTSGVGGMAGWVVNGTKILNCANRGTVAGTSSVGGLVGRNGNVESSYNLGIVKGVASAEAQIQGTNDSEDVGGIVGYHLGTVNKCYNDGPVTGYKNVGGIVGNNSGIVNQCHNIKTVEGMDSVGGIVGYNDGGTVQYCFNQGNVPSVYDNQGVETSIPFSGAVVGQKDWYGSTELNCYYLISDTVNASVGGINGKDSVGKAEAKTAEQFASGELTWKLNLGISDGTQAWYQTLSDSGNVKLPTLVPEGSGSTILNAVYRSAPCGISYSNEDGVVIEHTYVNGICTACDSFMQPTQNAEGYYEIDNAGKLYWFAEYVNSKVQIAGADTPDDTTDDVYSNSANSVLTANITVNENVLSDTYELNEGTFREWTPIGKQSNIRFEGIFDGQGYTVSGLYAYFENIATSVTGATLPQGMFGMLDDYAVVKNLTLADTYFYAEYGDMGAIVGWNTGTVENCFAEALLVSGSNKLGGIVGENYGSVKGCTFAGVLKSVSYIGSTLGGIVGHNAYGGKVQNCINLGDILGRNQVGGIVGSLSTNSGVVENCYNAGSLSGEKIKNYDLIIGQVIGDPETFASRVINCYYLADSESDTIYGTTAKTAAQFASGEVAYLLGDAFGQSLGENGDEYPIFANDANKVYMLANCDGTPYIYTNDAALTITEHLAGVSAAECFDENGVCLTCGTQAAARLTTADATPVVTYYMTLEDAIAAAQNAEGSTVTLLDDCASSINNEFTITSGSFKINFNGKKLMPRGDFSRALSIESGNITLFDDNEAQGGVSKMVVVLDATLTIDGGIFEGVVKVNGENGTLIIHNGTISQVEHGKGALTIKGGELSLLLVFNSSGKTPADVLPKDYYFYDKNGKIINAGAIVPDLYKYQVEDFTVKKGADLSKEAVITVSESEYNGVAQIPTVIVTVGGVVLESGVDYKSIGHGVPISAGSYTISIMGQGNYTGSVNVAYTIEKATPKADNFSGAMPDGAIYDGTAKTAFVEAKSGIFGMGEITVKYYKDGSEVESATNAGTYTVKISVAEGANYKAATDLEIGSFTIAKATPVVTPPTAIEDLIYNGELQAIATPGSTTGGTMQYAVYRGVYDGVGVPEGVWEEIIRTGPDSETETKAGTYSVLYRVAGDDNYESVAMQYITVTVGEATPTLNVTAPVSSVLPGNTILLSYTLTGVKDEVLTNLVTIESAKVGNLDCTIDGFKVTVPSAAVIGGEDKLVVTVISHAGGNYGASEKFTLTLEVGMADFTGEIADLETDIAELQELINQKADADQIAEKLDEINAKIQALEAAKDDYKDADEALKSELEQSIATAKTDVTKAYERAIADAVEKLEAADKTNADALAKAVENLEALIKAAEAYADKQDAALKSELEQSIATAKTDVTKAYEQAIADAVEKLEAADKTNADALAKAVEDLEALIKAAEAYADKQDASVKAALEEQILKANDLIASLDQRVTEAEKAIDEIETAIEKLQATDAADAKALEDAIAVLEQAIADAKQASVDADAVLKQELNSKIETADVALEAKVAEVQANLNKAVEELKAADSSNSGALTNAIETLNKAIEAAEAAAITGDTALDGKITEAQKALDAKIAEVQGKLDQAKADLEQAIKNGDTVLEGKISALTDALNAAEAALKAADAVNKENLEKALANAEITLRDAINGVQSNLDNVKDELDSTIAALQSALEAGDKALSEEIDALTDALVTAQAVLAKADADNKAELSAKIESADAILDAAVKAVQSNLDAAKAELNAAIAQGDKALSDEITALDQALADAKATLEKTDADNKAELVTKIDAADAALDAAVKAVQSNLDAAKAELNAAIAQGDKVLSDEIAQLDQALTDAKATLEKTDADNKAELVAKIDAADAALDAAIKAVQTNLDAAKVELSQAIESGDVALDDKIQAVNEALAQAKSVLEAADAAGKSELMAKMDEAYAALDAGIKAVQLDLDAAKAELEAAVKGLESEQQALAEELERVRAEAEESEQKTQTTQIVSVATVGAVNAGLLAGAFFFLRRKKLF